MVNFKELKGLNLKSIASLLPGDIFSLGEQDGYVSYFLDRMENGSDLFIAFKECLIVVDVLFWHGKTSFLPKAEN